MNLMMSFGGTNPTGSVDRGSRGALLTIPFDVGQWTVGHCSVAAFLASQESFVGNLRIPLMHREARPPAPQIHCRMLNGKGAIDGALAPDHRSEARLRIDPKVLVFVETTYTQLGKSIAELLVHNRINVCPDFVDEWQGFGVIGFRFVCGTRLTGQLMLSTRRCSDVPLGKYTAHSPEAKKLAIHYNTLLQDKRIPEQHTHAKQQAVVDLLGNRHRHYDMIWKSPYSRLIPHLATTDKKRIAEGMVLLEEALNACPVNERYCCTSSFNSNSPRQDVVPSVTSFSWTEYGVQLLYKLEVAGKSLPVLTNQDKGRYGVIVFENLDKYLNMDNWNRQLLDKYCRDYSVGIIGFVSPSEETLVGAQLRNFPLYVHTNLRLRDASLNPGSPVLRLTRAGDTAWGPLPGNDWAIFQHNHTGYEPLEWAQKNVMDYPTDGVAQPPLATVLQDHGQIDGIQRILFGSGLKFWLHRLLFLDSLSYLSHGQLSLSLERHILIDIDDIFVAEKGTRLKPDDVHALLATQNRIAEMVPGFRFNLGFSGKFFHHGTHEENLGEDMLLRNVAQFNWFSHMWNHQQPHLYDNLTQLMGDMMLNKEFAKEHGIPTDSGYSVSPHHSGVYPAHELLYIAWKKVWNIRVTSTEEYPHLRPARLRRAFIHRNIMVLPRQTCGLFTHTICINSYPGGREKLDESISGGELFQTIVYNPINIFMTHMSNYGNDRLALYTFESVFKFLRCWTNLKLTSVPPLQLGELYFKLHPEERDPIWGNPADDPKHAKIWAGSKRRTTLPKLLVLGPQKTGSTAFYTFLSMHPAVSSNLPNSDTFEEIQFFNGNNYYRGLEWYLDFFPLQPNDTDDKFMFEKSATYFDGELVPKRAHALLPKAQLVTILISPAKRAYSWYQHIKAHGDPIANNYSFYQVITATEAEPKALRDLRNRCLNPGKYAQHLERWLAYYPQQQLHIIDGEQLKSNPISVMMDLQRFLKLPPFDYSQHLRFDNKKGFYCQVVSDNHNKCLGKSKGRQYPPMDERSAKMLQK
ncbi:heparan sulfate N-deacetylase/N-sulfotransferase NDST2 [Anopheles darlingi]|uniref:[heparan sulfate]-glucosamine N-sulfotransferase n=1 Tax=Anopheles darlingi TaxID=43151 RepID=W5JGQ7_ANODA|nr:heparan sulfate N-deacetylase/N-sulfotransferase NDST2 [Anopheles darlingi]